MTSPSRPLTAKQAAYRDARVSGLDPSDAYRLAYDASRMSPKAISVEAARLEKHPAVALAITSLQEKAVAVAQKQADAAVASAAWIIAKSVEVAEYGLEMVAVRDMWGKPLLDGEAGTPVMRMRDWKAADASMNRLAKMHPTVFAPDATNIDARTLTLVLPDGTSLDDLKRLRQELG